MDNFVKLVTSSDGKLHSQDGVVCITSLPLLFLLTSLSTLTDSTLLQIYPISNDLTSSSYRCVDLATLSEVPIVDALDPADNESRVIALRQRKTQTPSHRYCYIGRFSPLHPSPTRWTCPLTPRPPPCPWSSQPLTPPPSGPQHGRLPLPAHTPAHVSSSFFSPWPSAASSQPNTSPSSSGSPAHVNDDTSVFGEQYQ